LGRHRQRPPCPRARAYYPRAGAQGSPARGDGARLLTNPSALADVWPGSELRGATGLPRLSPTHFRARIVMIDSGGIQEETSVLDVPYVTPCDSTGRSRDHLARHKRDRGDKERGHHQPCAFAAGSGAIDLSPPSAAVGRGGRGAHRRGVHAESGRINRTGAPPCRTIILRGRSTTR
jgi:hypothetical protein